MRLAPTRTAIRATAILVTTSLAIGLVGALAPAGQASGSRRLAGPGTAEAITGLMKALSGAPLGGLKLPQTIRWQLAPASTGSRLPVADRAAGSTGSIAGTVTGDGRPLDGICVLAERIKGSQFFKRTTTAKTGKYQLSGLEPGRYDVTFYDFAGFCKAGDNWLEQWYRGVDSPGPTRKTVAVPVRAGKVARGINGRLHHGGEITGTIRDTAGKPLSGICAETVSITGNYISISEAVSGKNGRYVLGGLFAGKYIASFLGCHTKGNYVSQFWRHAKSLSSANKIKVATRQVVTGIDPVMLPAAAILGTVRGGNARGKPVPGVCVTAIGSAAFVSDARTSKNGRFEVKGIGTGRTLLDFDPTCTGLRASPYLDADRTLKVTGGHVLHEGTVPLRVGARVTGVVRDSHGQRLAGVCVGVQDDNDDDAPPSQTRTGPNGTYSIVGIEPGKFTVRFAACATAESVLPQFYNDQPTENTADKITFRAGKTVSGIDATMQPAGTLTGLVTDRGGHPLAHVCVGIVSAGSSDLIDSGFESSVTTKSNGRYLLRNIIPGPYQVAIGCYGARFAGRWFDNQQDSAQGGFLSIPADLVTTVNGSVGQPGAISGTVTDQAGKPVSNICVFLVDPKTKTYINHAVGPPGFGPPLTEHGGRYQIRGLTPGQYLVSFNSCAGGKFADRWYRNGTTPTNATPVTVRPGRTTAASQEVVVGGSITGTVTGPSGQPANNICINAFDSASMGFQFTTTDKTGHYTLRGLDSGRYSVYYAPCSVKGTNIGAASTPAPVKVTRPRTTTVNIALKAGGTIAGKVLGGPNGGASQPGTCVLAVPTAPDGSLQTVMTKANGSYALPDLTPGKYKVYFGDLYCINFNIGQREATTAPQWFQDQAAETAATTITVRSGNTNTGIDAIMHPYGTISGTIESQSNQPVSGECVTAVPTQPQSDQADGEPIANVTAITNATGRYTLIGLPGQYKIRFSSGCGATGFATQWWNNASTAKAASQVTIAYGTTTGINATLHR